MWAKVRHQCRNFPRRSDIGRSRLSVSSCNTCIKMLHQKEKASCEPDGSVVRNSPITQRKASAAESHDALPLRSEGYLTHLPLEISADRLPLPLQHAGPLTESLRLFSISAPTIFSVRQRARLGNGCRAGRVYSKRRAKWGATTEVARRCEIAVPSSHTGK